ncbi:MAG: Daunorubicin/doxorubicin resistance ATP-binding protein DrrA [Chromatiales bacterium USCg_Taylor]|nr:MAG: Daunorubicin/doxorubicin resistance ATP-binding protein DrrA [Chromatiales bacterium USCg_Taylor]
MPALSIKNLHKTYKNGFQALKGIDLEVESGDFFALLGPNGAGKSTTIGIITGLVTKSGGSVSIYGHDIEHEIEAAKTHIGLVPQEINFSQFEPVIDIVVNQAGYYGLERTLAKQRAAKYLKALGLWEKRNDRSRTLSGGMKRRLMIARALVHEPKLLILDEPTAGVDIELRRSMWEFLRATNLDGTTIILTTHYLEEAERLCRRIAIIDQGEIIENTSMKRLVAQLDMETFILDIRQHLTEPPLVDGYHLRLVDETTLEVDVSKALGINELFRGLSEQGVEVVSMRNKANRLEELFIRLLDKSANNAHA